MTIRIVRFVLQCLFFLTAAPSKRMRFCLKTEIFSPDWPTVHTYPVKMVTESTSIQKRSP